MTQELYATHTFANGFEGDCDGSCTDDGWEDCSDCLNYEEAPSEYPVSGDETLREFGRNGQRSLINVWTAPKVRNPRATAGITKGSTIEVFGGARGIVTRVGTVSGGFLVNGKEINFNGSSVRRIFMPGEL